MKKRMTALLLCFILTLSALLSGCAAANAENLMADITPNAVSTQADLDGASRAAAADFAVKLLQASVRKDGGKNALLSPLSVLLALGMTANGAKGETLAQMEDVLRIPMVELNTYLKTYVKALPSDEKYKLHIANSIWFRNDESFQAERDFLQINADFYDAGLYSASFDNSTLRDINRWVDNNTDGMIKDILKEIPEAAVMYLINALAFDAEWQSIYKNGQVHKRTFTTEDGAARDAELMYSSEHRYLKDENASGVIKYYADGKYAFAALLPDEGVRIADYMASLTGERLLSILGEAQSVEVVTAIPKFKCEYSTELSDILKDMGMRNAFDMGAADFSGIGSSTEGPLYISRVLHKTFIAVDERGTRAGAATAVEMAAGSAAPQEEPKTVILDRPFVYMLIDCETNLPFFIGMMMDVDS
jgi:serpin B